MGDTWLKLEPKKTIKTITIIEDGYKKTSVIKERCFMCYKTDCVLIGLYGTCNSFGSFKGICLDCLEKLKYLERE